MGKIMKRAAVLTGVFLAATAVWFVVSWNHTDDSETVYTSMEAPSLPVVYAEMYGGEQNRLTGYRREMGTGVSRDFLTVLPEDRQLPLVIEEYGVSPLSLSYEIRSMDGQRLVERTEDVSWTSADGESRAVLPIQNLLSRGTVYLLHVRMETERHGEVHYYTRILWPEADHGAEMMALAREFSAKTLNESEAASLVTYLETDSAADNSSLGNVTLKSSFSQLTWAGLDMVQEGEMQVTLQELDGTMGQVQTTYQVSRHPEGGAAELYEVEDNYTMRWDEKRIYLMDFNRTVNQVFSGGAELFSGKRILLGIGNDDVTGRMKSPDGRYLAFVFNRELWFYDQTNCSAVKLFSFRSDTDESGRSGYGRHDIRILSVGNDGDVDFVVYGYMNRGVHEGYQGISVCHYEQDRRGSIEERLFVPSGDSFDELKRQTGRLCRLGDRNMLYLLLDGEVFGVDLSSGEYMVVAQDLREGGYAVSSDQKWLAWQEGQSVSGGSAIHLLDLESGGKQEIPAPDGTLLKALGFVQGDFVYGMARPGDEWILNGRLEASPMYVLQIVSGNLEPQTRYEPEGLYIANVRVEEARVHMDRLTKTGEHTYSPADDDTIVCNTAETAVYMEGIGWYASEERRKLYFIQLDKDVNASRGARISSAQRISYDRSEWLELGSGETGQDQLFYAYGRGKLQGVYTDFSEAVNSVYDIMGLVTDRYQRTLWNRVDRGTVRTLRDPQTLAYGLTRRLDGLTEEICVSEDMILLNGRGMTLREILYYVSQGYPVLAYTSPGRYALICAYDQYNVSFVYPDSDERVKMGLNDATAYFETVGNDFVCGLGTEE